MSIVKAYYKQTKRSIQARVSASLLGDDLHARAQHLAASGDLKKAAKLFLKHDLPDHAAPLFERLADDAALKPSKRLRHYLRALQLHQDPPTLLLCAQKASALPDLDPRDAAALCALLSNLSLWSLAGALFERLGDLDAAAHAYTQADDTDALARLRALPPPSSPSTPSLTQKITQKLARKLPSSSPQHPAGTLSLPDNAPKAPKAPKSSAYTPKSSAPAPALTPSADFRLRLEQLITMRDLGLVSPEEFEAKRLQILSSI